MTDQKVSPEAIELDFMSNLSDVGNKIAFVKEHGFPNFKANSVLPGGEAMAGEYRDAVEHILSKAERSLKLARENLKLL